MTQFIDLMPESTRRKLGHSSLVRRWALGFVFAITMIVVSSSLVGVLDRRVRAEVQTLRDIVDFNADQKRQAEKLVEQIEYLQLKIDLHDRLVLPIHLADVISVIGDLTPEDVSLTEMSLTPREKKRARGRRASRKSDGDSKKDKGVRRLIVELEGVASNDFKLAEFVGGLESHPLFSKVGVDQSRKIVVNDLPAREFGVTCEVDLSLGYRFSDALAEGSR